MTKHTSKPNSAAPKSTKMTQTLASVRPGHYVILLSNIGSYLYTGFLLFVHIFRSALHIFFEHGKLSPNTSLARHNWYNEKSKQQPLILQEIASTERRKTANLLYIRIILINWVYQTQQGRVTQKMW